MTLPTWELIARLCLGAVLGSIIGLERERLQWAAGLRTHMLVCVGATLFMIVSACGFTTVLGPHVVLDPSRVAAQVVSGIGFLGAGSILLRGEVIKGLTTAASLWTVAAIGLAVGGGLYVAAVAATVIILVILAGIKPLEERYRRAYRSVELRLKAEKDSITVATIGDALGFRASKVRQLVVRPGTDAEVDDISVSLVGVTVKEANLIREQLAKLPFVTNVSIAE